MVPMADISMELKAPLNECSSVNNVIEHGDNAIDYYAFVTGEL